MKKLLLTVVLLSIYLSAQSQNNLFFYERDKKVYLTPIANKFLVEFTDNEDKTVLENNNFIHTKISKKVYEVEGDLLQIQNAGQGIYNVNQLYSVQGSNTPLQMRNAIVLSWEDGITESQKNDLVEQYGLIYEWSNRLFSKYITNNPLLVSQMIYESGVVKYCHPSFLADFTPSSIIPNDTFFQHQFYLHNTGQVLNDGHIGTEDADIDAPEAWDITTGNSDIIIAIIDQGVTDNHPDLPNSRQLRLPLSDFYDGELEEQRDDDPSPDTGENHGNACAGIAAAEINNNEGVVGVAPGCTIMPIRVRLSEGSEISVLAAAITFAVDNGAHVISCSWGKPIVNGGDGLITAIEDAIAQGVVVVFASGNQADHYSGGTGFIDFPANQNEEIPNLIVVGSSDRNNQQANYSSDSKNNDRGIINIVAPSNTADNVDSLGEADNIWTIDIPGVLGDNPNPFEDLTSMPLPVLGEELPASGTNYLAYTGRFGGTSASTPQIAGVVALMLSVNPCLSVEQVTEILYLTADKVGGYDYNWRPGISKELGHGKVNAFKAVSLAQALYVDGLDLYTRDVPEDLGLEPDSIAENLWESEDIWVSIDSAVGWDEEYHNNPVALEENFVFVKVRNKGCSTTNGDEVVKLYWAKASTALTWPSYWDGSITSPALMGDEIGTKAIGNLEPGKDTVILFRWIPPNPLDYQGINDAPEHFCLLSRIIATGDPMTDETVGIPWNLGHNVRENNNIAWKNISVIEVQQGGVVGGTWNDDQLVGATVHIGNATDEVNTFDISFGPSKFYSGNSVFDEAEVTVTFDETSWNKWSAGGKQRENIEISREHRRQVILKNKNAKLKNLKFDPHERGLMNVSFNFLTKRLSSKKEFKYHVKQSISSTGEVVGGETYHIKLPIRATFSANAGGDIQISPSSPIQLNASDIYEDAIYNWYTTDGTLIQTGRDISVPTDSTRKYKLEVIATSDGFKDYDEIEVRVKPAEIISITPNPASNTAVIEYETQQITSAYLMVSMPFSASTEIFPLDIAQNTYTLNVSQYQTGVYGLLLVVDGQVVDQKGLIVE